MKAIHLWSLLLLGALALLPACTDDSKEDLQLRFDFNFAHSQHGWAGDFADYPVGEEDFYELLFAYDTLPAPLNKNQKALKLHGSNRSDDLFMFTKKQLAGLAPNTEYTLSFELELASQFPRNSIGAGGSPATSSYLKVGAHANEPVKVAKDGFYELNLDKGNQSQSGTDAIVIGDLSISGNAFVYELIERDNREIAFKATTDSQGRLWVFAGVDSGFEGITTFYITKISVRLQ